MKRFRHSLSNAALALTCVASGNLASRALAQTAPTDLTATWAEAAHVDLQWRNTAKDAVGVFVEYGNPGLPDFIVLTSGRPAMTSFRHRNVASETTFLYRIRPYFGPATEVVSIVTGHPVAGEIDRAGDGPLIPAAEAGNDLGFRHSLRRAEPGATPAELTVQLGRSPTTLELRWQDRASDEDGYLVEMAQSANQGFKISALLPPGATSYRMTRLPGETFHAFRVRAFYHGNASDMAQVTTPRRP